jgi:hypothetical protein
MALGRQEEGFQRREREERRREEKFLLPYLRFQKFLNRRSFWKGDEVEDHEEEEEEEVED